VSVGVTVQPGAGRGAESSGEQLDLAGRLSGDLASLDDFARALGGRTGGGLGERGREALGIVPRRIDTNPATVEKDLAKLVLALVNLVRQLMERQAARRVNAGSLSEDEVEQMGETFLKLEQRMEELRTAFGLEPQDLDLRLGSIRDLL
jgi:gas vesicle protein GvpK